MRKSSTIKFIVIRNAGAYIDQRAAHENRRCDFAMRVHGCLSEGNKRSTGGHNRGVRRGTMARRWWFSGHFLSNGGQSGGYPFVRRISTDKRACIHGWSRSRLVSFSETEPLQPKPIPPQIILTCHATISYCIRNRSLLLDNITARPVPLTLSFSIFCV